jgi:tetratricopeptide (TPR) repeat protein
MSLEENLELSAQQYRAGQHEQALTTCQQILQTDTMQALAWSNGAAALAQLGRWVDAYAYVQRALAIAPELQDAIRNCAFILVQLGRGIEGGIMLRNLGWAQYQAKQKPEAMQSYEMALRINANDVESLHVLAGLNGEDGHADLSLQLMNQALSIDPQHQNTLAAKGNFLGGKKDHAVEAEACFQTSLAINPSHWMTLYNYGVFLAGNRRNDEAIRAYELAAKAAPEQHLPNWNLSNLLLRLGDYPRAWPLYEWRWKTDHLKPAYLQFNVPLWTGQDLQGKRILLHFEQGYGDAFQFMRFAKDVAALGAQVSIFMPKEICDNFIDCAGVSQIIPWHSSLPPADFHAPLMSLPAPLGLTIQSIPNQVPYLYALPERLTKWRELLPPLLKNKKLRVGIAWCGRPTHDNDKNRSIAFAEFLPLIQSLTNIEFVSVQVAPRESDVTILDACTQIVRAEKHIADFSDTAALLMQLDLLISVDTSVVHLAAALGKPVWALIAASSDWRWLEDREDTAWYPNVRLFRQPENGEAPWLWDTVFNRIQAELKQLWN